MDPARLTVSARVGTLTLTLTQTLTFNLTQRTTSVELYLHWQSPPEVHLKIFEMDFLSELLSRL